MSKPLILIAEDEEKIAALLTDYLKIDGFETLCLTNGSKVAETVQMKQPDFVILDIMLPEKDGLTICKEIRQFSNVPIMLLTARVDETDRLLGLKSGADDYVCKPFLPREVVARVHVILRRSQAKHLLADTESNIPTKTSLHFRGITLYPSHYRCEVQGELIDLTPVEFRLLHTMMRHLGQVFSRETLMEHCYTDDRIISDRTIDSHLRNLRRKLNKVLEEELIHSVYGVGYKVE